MMNDGLFPFVKRCYKEILRDPVSLLLGAALPVILIIVLQILSKNNLLPAKILESYDLSNQLIGISIFAFSTTSFYAGVLVSKDRVSGYLHRLYSSDMNIFDYFIGYILPLLFISFLQSIMCMATCVLLELIFNMSELSIGFEYVLLLGMLIPIELIFICIGMLIGSTFKVSESIGFFLLITIFTTLTTNIFFPVTIFGSIYEKICMYLPFYPTMISLKGLINGNEVFPTYFITLGYSLALFVISFIIFKKKMHK